MESVAIDETPPVILSNEQNSDSVENFQKFVYELFDQNGILNDLRAYLRGHIVNVLKSSQTEDPLPCQKHFTQRLNKTFQALNIIIAEYLLRLEFSYSLSVFVSEIPLANMVFGFAKTLMTNADSNYENLKFKESDVWCILNYLGLKCDSEHASNVNEMYNNEENTPLLLCILKCMPFYKKEPLNDSKANSSVESVTSSLKSMDSQEKNNTKTSYKSKYHDKCKHYTFCKTCQNKMISIKNRYKEKKKNLAKDMKECNFSPQHVESLIKDVNVVERSLIEEMYQQLKTVYEAEVDMVKTEEEKRIKRSVESHSMQLQKKRDEMEERFKAREQQLLCEVEQKKRFLWGLARALREQHAHMARAMHAVRAEANRLTSTEDSLKKQLHDAEKLLKQRGEEMRTQISNELALLENHIETMKRERDSINKERSELEQLKNIAESNSKLIEIHTVDSDEVKNHYELLSNELSILKKYLEATKLQPKCVMERATLTDLNDVSSRLSIALNNSHDVEFVRSDDDKLISNLVVNDLKKQKVVNFSQHNLDEINRVRSRDRSRSSVSSEAVDMNNIHEESSTVRFLKEENERLNVFARQQREHIDELLGQQARLQAEVTAMRFRSSAPAGVGVGVGAGAGAGLGATADRRPPRTAPAAMPHQDYYLHRMNSSASTYPINFGWRKGGGEELSLFSDAYPRIMVPGDVIPFIGVLKERHNDSRRYLINQWRMLRRRVSPSNVISKNRNRSPTQRGRDYLKERTGYPFAVNEECNSSTPVKLQEDTKTEDLPDEHNLQAPLFFRETEKPEDQRSKTVEALATNKNREKSPKTVLREAKQKLKNKTMTSEQHPPQCREKSPNSVLREAKLRLRKLEIEAEAVEQSYLDFRRRQRERNTNLLPAKAEGTKNIFLDIDLKQSDSLQKLCKKDDIEFPIQDMQQITKRDFEKYLRSHQVKFNIGEMNLKNKNTSLVNSNPISTNYKNIEDIKDKINYLETPLTEFRRFYHSEGPVRVEKTFSGTKPQSPVTAYLTDSNESPITIEKTFVEHLESPTNSPAAPSLADNIETPLSIKETYVKCPQKSPVTANLADRKDVKNHETNKDKLIKTNNNKKSELEILKRNIHKIYNLNQTDNENLKAECLGTSLQHTNNVKTSTSGREVVESNLELHPIDDVNEQSPKLNIEKNLIRVEVESVSEVNNLEGETPSESMLLVVHSTIDATKVVKAKSDVTELRPQMTIIVSPKIPKVCSEHSPRSRSSISPDQVAKLNRNDALDAIFHIEGEKQVSSSQIQLELSNDILEPSLSDFDKGENYKDNFDKGDDFNEKEDYKDDFSADVDNYNSKSDYENGLNSPMSIPKTSEDDNFWDT